MRTFLLGLLLSMVPLTSFAQDRFAYLCGAEYLANPKKYRTEFHLVVDLSTVHQVNTQRFLAAYVQTNSNSLVPRDGFAEVITLELTKLEQLGDKIWFDIKATDLEINKSKISFGTIGLGLPYGASRIFFDAEVDGKSLTEGLCVRKPDQDSRWLRP